MAMPPCSIYALINPLDNSVFYVGKTINKINSRVRAHIAEAKRGRNDKDILIQKIIAFGKTPEVKILQTKKYPNYKWTDMAKVEKGWVLKMLAHGFVLTNKVYAKKQVYI